MAINVQGKNMKIKENLIKGRLQNAHYQKVAVI